MNLFGDELNGDISFYYKKQTKYFTTTSVPLCMLRLLSGWIYNKSMRLCEKRTARIK
jgi:hypothetical protein